MKRKEPARLAKKPEKKEFKIVENGLIRGIPVEFILITIIMVSFFIWVLLFMGPASSVEKFYNMGL